MLGYNENSLGEVIITEVSWNNSPPLYDMYLNQINIIWPYSVANLAFLYNENSIEKQRSDDWSAGRIRLLSQIIDQQIKTNRHDHRVHSDPL